ncbi:conjugal transfer protein TraH [Hydrocarboniclastica marina]|nr:conjugal transfer protein TraH [Hydrocarboniclastica marina]
MSNIFGEVGSMANVSEPRAFETQSRGGFSLGSVQLRNKIIDQDIVTWQPPSAKAGCGGLDLNGGSFSFINSDQIVETLRAVAANAKGYAFQLALDATYPEAANWIEVFQNKIQAMNDYLGNSCQLAQGIVTGGKDAIQAAWNNDDQELAAMKDAAKDRFDAAMNFSPVDSASNPLTQEGFKFNRGNLVLKALQRGNAAQMFRYGDDELLQTLMSLTGTIVIKTTPEEPETNAGANTDADKTLPESTLFPTLSLADFVHGSKDGVNVKVYKCDEMTQCENPTSEYVNDFKGFETMVVEVLLGSETRPGVIAKYMSNVGSFTENEKAVVLNLPNSQGTFIRNLAIRDPGAARDFAEKAAKAFAIQISYELAQAVFKAVELSLNAIDNPQLESFSDTLAKRKYDLREQYRVMREEQGVDVHTLMASYDYLIKNTKPTRYLDFNTAAAKN